MTSISVVVPSYGRAHVLARCLSGIEAQTKTPNELVVVVRRDDLKTLKVVEDHQARMLHVRSVEAPERGLVAALNAGLRTACGEIVVFVDDDAVPRPDWLRRIVDTYATDRSIAAVGGKDVVHYGDLIDDSQSERFLKRLRSSGPPTVGRVQWFGRVIGNHNAGHGGPRDVDFLKGVNMSYRREDVESHGFDTRLLGRGVQMHTEATVCLPLRRAGKRVVYDPQILVDHYPAVRPHGDHREGVDRARIHDESHNQLLSIIDGMPATRRTLVIAYGFLVGSASYPGLLNALRLRTRGTKHAWPYFRAAGRGRITAIRTARHAGNRRSKS